MIIYQNRLCLFGLEFKNKSRWCISTGIFFSMSATTDPSLFLLLSLTFSFHLFYIMWFLWRYGKWLGMNRSGKTTADGFFARTKTILVIWKIRLVELYGEKNDGSRQNGSSSMIWFTNTFLLIFFWKQFGVLGRSTPTLPLNRQPRCLPPVHLRSVYCIECLKLISSYRIRGAFSNDTSKTYPRKNCCGN